MRQLGTCGAPRLVPSAGQAGGAETQVCQELRQRQVGAGPLRHLLFSTDMQDFLRGPICRWASTLSRKKAGFSLLLKSLTK